MGRHTLVYCRECVFMKEAIPRHGDTLQLNEWVCLHWNLGTPQEEGGGLPAAGKWLAASPLGSTFQKDSGRVQHFLVAGNVREISVKLTYV